MIDHATNLSLHGSVIALLAMICVTTTACTNTATITHREGIYEARIVGGDADHLYVEHDGEKTKLSRDDVYEIDHPGNVLAVVGGSLLGMGVFQAAMIVATHDDDDGGIEIFSDEAEVMLDIVLVSIWAVPGATMLGVGLHRWLASTGAVEEGVPTWGVAPWIAPDHGQARGGLAAIVRF